MIHAYTPALAVLTVALPFLFFLACIAVAEILHRHEETARQHARTIARARARRLQGVQR